MQHRHHPWHLSLMFLLALTGCSAVTPHVEATKVPLPPKPIVRDSFSLLPLNEEGWIELQEGNTVFSLFDKPLLAKGDTVLLGAKGSVQNETRTIAAFVRPMPAKMTDDDFAAFAQSVKKIESATRFEVLKREVRPDRSTGKNCVNVRTTLKDLAPKSVVANIVITHPPMIIDSLYWVCKHPDGRQAVIVEYSDRFFPGNEEADFDTKAATVFHGLAFGTH